MHLHGMRKECCPNCGSAVVVRHTFDGARYLIPVSDESLFKLFSSREDVDDLMRDRLRRAERIITELRAKLRVVNGQSCS